MAFSNTPSPTTRFGIFVLIAGVTLVFVCWGILRYLSDAKHSAGHAPKIGGATPTATAGVSPTPGTNADKSDQAAAKARLSERISQALAVLRDPNNPNKKDALEALKKELREAEPTVAVAVIRQFLDQKQDAPTGLRFTVGDDHELETAPTMRTFLMDELGNISLGAKLGDAAEVARATLETKDSPDEWALAMRNLALADPEGSRSLLTTKVKELLGNAEWQKKPSGGYLEAFDVIAYTGDTGAIQDLNAMFSSPNGTLGRAARIAMQNMSAVAPEQVSTYLNANPNALSDYPMIRADYMGNVDLASPTQLAQAETYLARADVNDAEKTKFIQRLVMPAGFVSNNLVTPSNLIKSVPEQHALVNQVAQTWLASGKYPTLESALQGAVTATTPKAGGE